MPRFYRVLYVPLGAVLGAVAGYLFAKYFVLLFGIALHMWSPDRYSFDHVMAVVLSTRHWLRPLAAVICGAYAALACFRFGRVAPHSN